MSEHVEQFRKVVDGDVAEIVKRELEETGGILRLAPCWVPRSFLQPGKRLKLHPDDLYAFGLNRGGIDERWFGSTTEAANAGRTPDEGLSYAVIGDKLVQLRLAVQQCGSVLVGEAIWKKYGKWPVYSKFFDNMGPIPHHMHQSSKQAALLGLEGKPESYYFPVQHNPVGNNFPYTFFGLNPGTTKAQVRTCLENWNKGDNGILDLSSAHRLKPGSGWLVGPGILHAPGSLCTYEPQWGSDVFGMYQSLVEGREVPWELLVKDVPQQHHHDLDYLVEQLDWEANVDPSFKENHYLEPIEEEGADGSFSLKWIVYGPINDRQDFSAKELTVYPGEAYLLKQPGAYTLTCIQGCGAINAESLSSPKVLRFNQIYHDEYFVAAEYANEGMGIHNSGDEPLVCLMYFGPDVHDNMPTVGAYSR